MRSIGNLGFLAGGVVVAAAWMFGANALPPAYLPVARVLAELLAVLCLVLAWRFGRGRLAVVSVFIAVVNVMLRGPLSEQIAGQAGLELTALGLLLPLNLCAVVLSPERPVQRPVNLIFLVAAAAQAAIVVLWVQRLPVAPPWLVSALEVARTPQASLLCFLAAMTFTFLAMALRRGAFESSMLWVLAASALAVHGGRGAADASLLLAAAQLVLLLGLVQDSYRLAYLDELTGLPGRRALEEALKSLSGNYVIAMADVDNFKRFNDRHGHASGDQALRMVAECLRAVDGGGKAYRYGGEEFAVLYASGDMAQSKVSLESLRVAIAERRFGLRSPKRPRKKPDKPSKTAVTTRQVRVTVSIGAAMPNARRPTPDDVIRAADRALYRAKKAGRNRVVCS